MKIEQLIVQHLYNNRQVTLEDIGTFYLSPDVMINMEDKDAVLPEKAITFEYQPKAPRDEALVDFIVQHSRKIKPLATSDLESYSILGREYLNIGKPFYIEGLGTLTKTQFGTYEFTQGTSINPRLEAQAAHHKDKEEHAIDFSSPSRKRPGATTGMVLVICVVLMAIAATIIYFFNRDQKVQVTEQPLVVSDSVISSDTQAVAVVSVVDSIAARDSVMGDGYTFKIVLKRYQSKAAADKAYAKFLEFNPNMQLLPQDTGYIIVVPFNRPLSDTLRVRDSLAGYFALPTYLLR